MSNPATTEFDPLDLNLAKQIVTEMLAQIEYLDGQVPPSPRGNAPGSGDLAQELLNTADQLQLASSLVRNTYWNWKGQYAYDI